MRKPILKMIAFSLGMAISTNAFGEYNWNWTVGCPESGTSNPAASFSATTTSGYSLSGTCERTGTHFTIFDVTTPASPTPNSDTFFGLSTGNILLVPGVLPYETKPVVMMTNACPVEDKSLNWLIFAWKITDRLTLSGINMMGRATFDTATGLQIDNGYDVNGTLLLTGPVALSGNACANGTFALTGSGDRGGTVYFTKSGEGYYNTVTEKSFFFVPQYTVSAVADLGSKTFQGMSFNSTDAATAVAYQVTADAAGTTWTLEPYSDVTTGAIDGSYTETISITSVNNPANGMLRGTITRVGGAAGTGSIACVMNKTVATRVLCAAESPEDNTIPYSILFTIEGPQLIGQASGTSVTADGGINTTEGVYNDGTHLLIADSGNNRVLIWNTLPASNQTSPDIVLGQPNMESAAANNGGRSASSLSTPRAVWSNGTRVFVADTSNNRILIWNTFPTANQQSADLVLGQTSFTSGGANNPSRAANSLSAPYSVHSDGTKLYVADNGNNRVLIWNTLPVANQTSANVVLGQPNFTSATANNGARAANSLNSPRFAFSDGTKLFVSDTTNNRILIWNTIPTVNRTSANVELGQPNFTTATANNGGRTANSISGPRGVASNGTKLFVADTTNNRILVWNTIPTVNNTSASLVLGQPNFTSGTANNGGIAANTLSSPRAVHVAGTKLYAADTSNYRILLWDPIPTTTQENAGNVQGQPNFSVGTANNNLLNEQSIAGPQGVHYDGTKFFVADTINNRVLIFNSVPAVNHVGADVVLGQPDAYQNAVNNGGLSASTMSAPAAVFSNGTKLFVADTGNNRILIWNTIPTVTATAADVVIGQANTTSGTANNGGRNGRTMSAPDHVMVDGTKMYVADTTNNRVMIWNTIPTVTGTTCSIVLGQPNTTAGTANNGGRDGQTLSGPRSVHSDGTKLYVGDTANNRVLIWNTIPTVTQTTAAVVLGQPNTTAGTANNGGRDLDSLSGPYGVFVSGTKLYVADTTNNRVMIWNTIPTVTRTSASTFFGQPNESSGTANNGGLSSSRLSSPRRIVADAYKFFVADTTNNRIIAADAP